MMNVIWLNIDYCLKRIKVDFYFFVLLVMSFASSMLIPTCVIGMGISLYNYSFTYIPEPANQTITLNLNDDENILLRSEEIKEKFPEVEFFSLNQNLNTILWEDGNLVNVTVAGVQEDIKDIFRFHTIKGTEILNYTGLDPESQYCWIGSDLYFDNPNKRSIIIDEISYNIAGVVHNRQVQNMILIDASHFLNHSDESDMYSIRFKDSNITNGEISSFINEFQSELGLENKIYWSDWTGYKDYNHSIFNSVLGVILTAALLVLFYGSLNLSTLLINKLENQRKEMNIQWYLGIPIKQLYLQETVYIVFVLVCATAIDWVIVTSLQYYLMDFLKNHITVNGLVLLLVMFFETIIALLGSYLLLSKRLRILSK